MRRERRPRRSKWVVIILALCILMTPALLFYPVILRTVSPRSYVAYAAARTETALSRDTERLNAAWGLSVWDTLLREPSYITAGLTLEAREDDPSDSPFPDGLHGQMEFWRDGAAGMLTTRQVYSWGDKTFALESWLGEDALTVYAPQLFGKPLSFVPDGFGRAWNGSFLTEIAELPEGLSLSAPRAPEPKGKGLLQTLLAEGRVLAQKASLSEVPMFDALAYTISLPESDARGLLETALQSCRGGIDLLRILPDFDETWNVLLGGLDEFSNCEVTLVINQKHYMNFEMSFSSAGENTGDKLTLSVSPDGWPALADRLIIKAHRVRSGSSEAMFELSAGGLVTPAESGQMEANISIQYDSGTVAHSLDLNLTLGLTTAMDNLQLTVDWDDIHAECHGGYAVDAETPRVSITVDRLSLQDGVDAIELTGHLQWDWRRVSDKTPPPPPSDAQPLEALDRFERKALLDSYYRLFYG